MGTDRQDCRWKMPARRPATETSGRVLTPSDIQDFAGEVLADKEVMDEFRRANGKFETKEEMSAAQWPLLCYSFQYLYDRSIGAEWNLYLSIGYQLVLAIERGELDSVRSDAALRLIDRYSRLMSKPQPSTI